MLRGAREHRKDASLSHNAFLQPEEPIVRGRGGEMDCTTDTALSPAPVWPEGEVHRGRLRPRFPRKRALTLPAPLLLLWDRLCPATYPERQTDAKEILSRVYPAMPPS